MSKDNSSYKSIFKATSLFGGVQFYQISIQIIKSKIVAVLLGPSGVGIMGLLTSGMQLIQSFTNMGLASSAVRDVSEANGQNDVTRIFKTVCVVRKLVWITGLLGLVVTAALSPVLSKTSFGNYDYTMPFIVLSITLLLDQINSGQKVVLQGLRRLKDLAKCSAFGVTFGLIVSVPLYYWLGIKGIVPTLILTSICSLFLSWLYSRKIKIEKVRVTPREALKEGKQMLVMGISMSLSGIFSTIVAYAIRAYIQNIGGVEEVGLYQAGFVIMTTYVGMITNAIATDYYPRLAAINHDNAKCMETVSQQGEIGSIILAPMLTACIIFMPFVLMLLYSDRFIKADEYISWACLGMMLRLAAWVISFLFVAKAESKLFIFNEAAACFCYLVFSIIGYKYWGLQGLGAAFALHYLVYFIQVYVIAKRRYQFKFSISFIKTYIVQLFFVCICLCIVLITDGPWKYGLGVTAVVSSTIIALYGLNNKIGLTAFLRNKINKK